MERLPTPDPVAEAAEYQRYLTGLVGDDDPAEVQAGSAEAWREVIRSAGARVAERPEPDEWSVLECLGHVTDSEVVVASRYRWIVAHDEPPLVGYDQDLWVDRLHHNEDDPEVLLETFDALRRANLALWARSTGRSGPASACTPSADPRASISRSTSRPATTASTWTRPVGRSRRSAEIEAVGWAARRC